MFSSSSGQVREWCSDLSNDNVDYYYFSFTSSNQSLKPIIHLLQKSHVAKMMQVCWLVDVPEEKGCLWFLDNPTFAGRKHSIMLDLLAQRAPTQVAKRVHTTCNCSCCKSVAPWIHPPLTKSSRHWYVPKLLFSYHQSKSSSLSLSLSLLDPNLTLITSSHAEIRKLSSSPWCSTNGTLGSTWGWLGRTT